MDTRKFKNPPAGFRSAPLWSWNDELDVKELKRQLFLMKQGGMGGGFIHGRRGHITPYFSREWMNCVRESVKYAKKLRIPMYLYDEDGFPSGYAGGLIKNKKNYMKVIKIDSRNKRGKKFEIINLIDLEQFKKSWLREYFNNTGYLDTLNRNAVGQFIESTHGRYKKLLGNEFGKTIPAIFTDDVGYLIYGIPLIDKGSFFLPWTEGFDKIFIGRYKYDIKDNICSLVEKNGNYRKVRYDYYKLLNELFVNSFVKQIYEWCDKYNIAFTGHFIEEDTLQSQVKMLGSAMPFYEYMHYPGIDQLGRQFDCVYLTLKQCSSVAHQLDKKRVLIELFGGSRQDLGFMDRKIMGNWAVVLGANLFAPHLWHYSLAGARKRDWPPTLSYQQPWWRHNKGIEDYFARINYIMSSGKFNTGIAVLHPIESAWCHYTHSDKGVAEKLNDDFVSLLRTLSGSHYDYDLCDESLLAKYGTIKDEKLAVGRMEYKLLIIPRLYTLRDSTVKILNEFIDAGGIVAGLNPAPGLVDALKNNSVKKLFRRINRVSGNSELLRFIENTFKREISIRDSSSREIEHIFYQHRINSKENVYFLANTGPAKTADAKIEIPAKPEEIIQHWNTETGEITEIDANYKNNALNFPLYFPEAGSHIIVKTEKTGRGHGNYRNFNPENLKVIQEIPVDGWKCRQKDLNSLAVDFCYFGKNRKDYGEKMFFLDMQNHLLGKYREGGKIFIKYNFSARLKKKPENMYLVLERPEQYKIRINSRGLKFRDMGYWIDSSFKKTDIKNHVNLNGENTIELEARFKRPEKKHSVVPVKGGTEIETIFIAGNFNVEGKYRRTDGKIRGSDFMITDEKMPAPRDIVTTGYPFYAGRFIFENTFLWSGGINRNIYLKTNKLNASSMKIKINGKEKGVLLWQPFVVDITDSVIRGENKLELEITNSLRNLLGPHHCYRDDLTVFANGAFADRNYWTDEYILPDYGLNEFSVME